jgi:hypothetical protein
MAKVTIVKVGHALIAGERGEKGGKPSKDSIWGIAQVDNVLLSFSGRRNAVVLKYKTHPKADADKLQELFALKLEGKDVKGIPYTEIAGEAAIEALIPNLVERIGKGYYASTFAGKVDTRKTKAGAKKAKAAKKAVDAVAETATETAAV